MEKQLYWGSLPINSIEEVDLKGPSGEELVRIQYGSYPPQLISKTFFDEFSSEKESDLVVLLKKKSQIIAELISPTFISAGIKISELQTVLSEVNNYLVNYSNRAINVKLNESPEFFVPGLDPVGDKTILDYYEINEANPDKGNSSDGTDGSGS